MHPHISWELPEVMHGKTMAVFPHEAQNEHLLSNGKCTSANICKCNPVNCAKSVTFM